LGDIVANSALNEPLKGRIELLSALPDELDSLKISLADSTAFAKAGVDRSFILGKLKFTLQRSVDDEPDYIRVSSQIPIQEPFLNFLVEVVWSNGRILREYTILLDPPSYDFRSRIERPAEPEGVATNIIQDAVSVDTSQQPEVSTYLPVTNFTGSDYGPTSRLDTLSEIADKTRSDKSINLNKMMMAIFRANPEAFINQNINGLKGGYVLRIPDGTMINELTSTEALNKVRSHHAAWGDATYTEDTTIQEQPQTIAEVVSEEEKIVDTSEVDVVDSELRLVVADDGTEATQETGSTEPSKSDDLLVAEETIETLTQENLELKARLKELETLVAKLQPLLSLKDDELAAYQDQLATKVDTAAIEEESESSKAIADTLEDTLAEVDADFEE
jgi:pilus assembly protein FimV